MKFKIGHMLAFFAFIALELRFVQMQFFGLAICALAILFSIFAILGSILLSESKDGMLDVSGNASVRVWQIILLLAILNLFVVFGLQLVTGANTFY